MGISHGIPARVSLSGSRVMSFWLLVHWASGVLELRQARLPRICRPTGRGASQSSALLFESVSRSSWVPFLTPFSGWEGSPTRIDCRKKGTLILNSVLEDLGVQVCDGCGRCLGSVSK